MQLLPYKDLQIESDISLRDILNTHDEQPVGYIVDVDSDFPIELHDKLKEFVPAPQNIAPNADLFSEFQRDLA